LKYAFKPIHDRHVVDVPSRCFRITSATKENGIKGSNNASVKLETGDVKSMLKSEPRPKVIGSGFAFLAILRVMLLKYIMSRNCSEAK